jgi:2-polyprenyl-6-methoxyphenol hydroxylase-like FAD-dependent oxidoreductase
MVTLIGDAIHVMSPTAAVGATTALQDAAALLGAISDGGVNAKSVSKYEASMRVYAEEAISRSAVGGKWLFGMRPFDELKTVYA